MKTYRINVTAKDIREGGHASDSCPISRAMRRHRRFRRAVVFISVWRFRLNATARAHPLPGKAAWFIQRFDNNKTVRPFRFTITLP